MMMGPYGSLGEGMGWGGWVAMALAMVVVWGLIATGIVVILRSVGSDREAALEPLGPTGARSVGGVKRAPLSPRDLVFAGMAVVVLAGASTAGAAAATGAFRDAAVAPVGQCSAPALGGTVIDVSLTNMMTGQMMGGRLSGGSMRLLASANRIPAGMVTFRVRNLGTLAHELVVLPLAAGQNAGDRVPSADGRIAETGSLGEASNSCGDGAGTGLASGSSGWVTLQLPPGRYELVCNLAGHYAASMYEELTVT